MMHCNNIMVQLKTASDTVMSLQAAVLSEPMKNNLVKEINEALEKVANSHNVLYVNVMAIDA